MEIRLVKKHKLHKKVTLILTKIYIPFENYNLKIKLC